MGAAFSLLSVGEWAQIAQSWHQLQRDETWSRRGYDMGLQSMRIDMINTVREEMRDQVTVIISSLDNLMVVATLMLSIGFGFSVEGTFPPPEHDYDYDEVQQCLLVLYAVLAAFSLVFPLACLMLTIAARFEVELCQQDVMGDLQKHLMKALQEDQPTQLRMNDQGRAEAVAAAVHRHMYGGSIPEVTPTSRTGDIGSAVRSAVSTATTPLLPPESMRGREASDAGPAAAQRWAARSLSTQGFQAVRERFMSLVSPEVVGRIAEDEIVLLAEGLLQKVNHYHKLYPIAQLFLWLGMLCSVLVCSVLLGLYFVANFPSTPWMWRLYSGTLCVCAMLSVSFYVWMKYSMLTKVRKTTATQEGPGFSMPRNSSRRSVNSMSQPSLSRDVSRRRPRFRRRAEMPETPPESDDGNFHSAVEDEGPPLERRRRPPVAACVPLPRLGFLAAGSTRAAGR